MVTAKLNGLNQRAYVEWLLDEMPNDAHLREPGRIDRYLPWSVMVRLPVPRAPGGGQMAENRKGGPPFAYGRCDLPHVDGHMGPPYF